MLRCKGAIHPPKSRDRPAHQQLHIPGLRDIGGDELASAPSACTSWRTASPRSTPLLAMTTLAPSRAKLKAVARPMPELPPVMSATAPAKTSLAHDTLPPCIAYSESIVGE